MKQKTKHNLILIILFILFVFLGFNFSAKEQFYPFFIGVFWMGISLWLLTSVFPPDSKINKKREKEK